MKNEISKYRIISLVDALSFGFSGVMLRVVVYVEI